MARTDRKEKEPFLDINFWIALSLVTIFCGGYFLFHQTKIVAKSKEVKVEEAIAAATPIPEKNPSEKRNLVSDITEVKRALNKSTIVWQLSNAYISQGWNIVFKFNIYNGKPGTDQEIMYVYEYQERTAYLTGFGKYHEMINSTADINTFIKWIESQTMSYGDVLKIIEVMKALLDEGRRVFDKKDIAPQSDDSVTEAIG